MPLPAGDGENGFLDLGDSEFPTCSSSTCGMFGISAAFVGTSMETFSRLMIFQNRI